MACKKVRGKKAVYFMKRLLDKLSPDIDKWRQEIGKGKCVGMRGAGVSYLARYGREELAQKYFNQVHSKKGD